MTRRPKNDLEFLGDSEDSAEPEGELEETPEPLRRVKVLPPFRVCHAGVAYTPDEIAEIPESLASQWVLNRWVSPAE